MPKINLVRRQTGGRNIETGERYPDPDPRRVSVGWSKEGYGAQIGVGWVAPQAVAADDLTYAGQNKDLVSTGETDEDGTVWHTQWLDLDRALINDLIRALRKARDEAFGRDE